MWGPCFKINLRLLNPGRRRSITVNKAIYDMPKPILDEHFPKIRQDFTKTCWEHFLTNFSRNIFAKFLTSFKLTENLTKFVTSFFSPKYSTDRFKGLTDVFSSFKNILCFYRICKFMWKGLMAILWGNLWGTKIGKAARTHQILSFKSYSCRSIVQVEILSNVTGYSYLYKIQRTFASVVPHFWYPSSWADQWESSYSDSGA